MLVLNDVLSVQTFCSALRGQKSRDEFFRRTEFVKSSVCLLSIITVACFWCLVGLEKSLDSFVDHASFLTKKLKGIINRDVQINHPRGLFNEGASSYRICCLVLSVCYQPAMGKSNTGMDADWRKAHTRAV